MPSHYLNQCSGILLFDPWNKLRLNLNRNSCIFVQENAFEDVWKMATIWIGLNVLNSSPMTANTSVWRGLLVMTVYQFITKSNYEDIFDNGIPIPAKYMASFYNPGTYESLGLSDRVHGSQHQTLADSSTLGVLCRHRGVLWIILPWHQVQTNKSTLLFYARNRASTWLKSLRPGDAYMRRQSNHHWLR